MGHEEQAQNEEKEEGDEKDGEQEVVAGTTSARSEAPPAKKVAPEPKESENDSSDDDALIGMPKPRAAAEVAAVVETPSERYVPHAAKKQSEGLRQRRPESAASSSKDGTEKDAVAKSEDEEIDDEGAEKLMRTV